MEDPVDTVDTTKPSPSPSPSKKDDLLSKDPIATQAAIKQAEKEYKDAAASYDPCRDLEILDKESGNIKIFPLSFARKMVLSKVVKVDAISEEEVAMVMAYVLCEEDIKKLTKMSGEKIWEKSIEFADKTLVSEYEKMLKIVSSELGKLRDAEQVGVGFSSGGARQLTDEMDGPEKNAGS